MGLLKIYQTIERVKDYSNHPWGWVDHGYIEDGALTCFDGCHIFKATKEQKISMEAAQPKKNKFLSKPMTRH